MNRPVPQDQTAARLVPEPGGSRAAINLPPGHPLVVGRRGQGVLVIDGPELSRRHAVLWLQDGSWRVRDEGSLNGTFVNGQRITETVLAPGDRVNFGGKAEYRLEIKTRDQDGTRTAHPVVARSDTLVSRLFCLGLAPQDGGRTLVLRRPLTIVGRNATADLVLDDPGVSGIHARIERSGGRTNLLDSGSRNGTVVNGKTVKRAVLAPGDEVVFGNRAFLVKRTLMPTGTLMVGVAGAALVMVLAFLLPALFRAGTGSVDRLWTRDMYLAQVSESLVLAVRALDTDPPAVEVARAQFAVARRSLVAADLLPLEGSTERDLREAFTQAAAEDRVARELADRDIFDLYRSLDEPRTADRRERERQPEAATGSAAQASPPGAGEDFDLDQELSRLVAQFGIDTRHRPIPSEMRAEVARFIEFWTGPRRNFTQRTILRSREHLDMIREQMYAHQLPEVFSYLPFIESGYQASITSAAKARGLWQFMPGTGRAYGLRVDGTVDERIDPEKSTAAACRYLESLLNMFGPNAFLCAVAAYNKGENGMARCLKKYGDWHSTWKFWDVVKRSNGCLKQETVEYVPRFLAAAIIMRRPEVFGFSID